MEKIKVIANLTQLQGDMGQYRQQSVILQPENVQVAVELEANPTNFANPEISKWWADNESEALVGGTPPKLDVPEKLILTLEGVKKLRDTIQDTLTEHENASEDWSEKDDFEDW